VPDLRFRALLTESHAVSAYLPDHPAAVELSASSWMAAPTLPTQPAQGDTDVDSDDVSVSEPQRPGDVVGNLIVDRGAVGAGKVGTYGDGR
jgi:hypothetical protein